MHSDDIVRRKELEDIIISNVVEYWKSKGSDIYNKSMPIFLLWISSRNTELKEWVDKGLYT